MAVQNGIIFQIRHLLLALGKIILNTYTKKPNHKTFFLFYLLFHLCANYNKYFPMFGIMIGIGKALCFPSLYIFYFNICICTYMDRKKILIIPEMFF